MIAPDVATDIAHVDCGACHACCRNQLVTLTEVDPPDQYDCHETRAVAYDPSVAEQRSR